MHLTIRDISQHFEESQGLFRVLQAIDLEVASGAFVCVLGPSGCGKSTLLNLLMGLTSSSSGEITIDGKRVNHVRQHAAYMQQKDLLLPWCKALPNAILGARLQGMANVRAEREATALFEQFGLSGYEHRYPAELSGGMRQRVALVRTLLTHRPLWLLDEPFGALDTLTRMKLHKWMLKAWKSFEKSILMVTHDLDEALLLADRIYVFGPRPAQVEAVWDVPLARPRDAMSLEFAQAKRSLWQAVRGVLVRDVDQTESANR